MVDLSTCMGGCALGTEYTSWQPIIALVVLTVLLLLSLIFMFARILGRREWEALARIELTHTLAAVIWVVIIGAFALGACSAACTVTKDENPFTTASDYVSKTRSTLESQLSQLIEIARDTRFKSSDMYFLGGVIVRPWQGCNAIAGNFEFMSVMLAPFIGSLIVQQYFLSLVSNLAFQALLPIGIVLRLIPFAREMGAFLIALSVALYIILPLTYVFAVKAMDSIPAADTNLGLFGQKCTPTPIGDLCAIDCVNPVKTQQIFESIGYSLPQAVFFPALSMIITLGSARVLSKVFMYDFQELM